MSNSRRITLIERDDISHSTISIAGVTKTSPGDVLTSHINNLGATTSRIKITTIAPDNPKIVSEFRPINLCNSRYKLASKVMVNRLKPYLNTLVSPLQNGFIPERSINDNISMPLKFTHTIRTFTTTKNGLAAIKIDMSKVFDRINWKFLFNTLKKFNFPDHWIHFIKEC
ncbi:hypothetical protein LIER_38258 [Lithospermum erythrorhizon]|uniref:Reverse transcriptase domain-containing protein n=1 Tax=Lithospermum erythrorhizon TaxID=34254 RepID=A0AAV3PYK9_LITER